jgi:hypothetical protein
VSVAALATIAAVFPASALATSKGWTLTVRPAQVAPGGSITIKTNAGRKCALTIRVGGTNYHYRLPRGGSSYTLSAATPLGKGRVTVHCKGRVAAINLNVVSASGTQPAAAPPPATTPPPPPPPSNPPPASTQTPITVANVCALNPALGPIHYMTSAQGWPTAYWTDGTGSKVTLMAFSDDGDNKVDVAVVVTPDGQGIAYFAYCNWTGWLDVAQFEAQQAQQGVPNSQASSLAYLLEEQTDDAIFQEDQTWFQPAIGWQVCPGDATAMCDYEPDDPPF